jgi:outer membrane protein insertion porin family
MLRTLIGGILLAHATAALAQSPAEFVVGDIRVEGLQRISEGTVYNYLPVNIGDRLDERRVQESVRALFATGFFSDIEVRRDGATLVIVVLERPSISSAGVPKLRINGGSMEDEWRTKGAAAARFKAVRAKSSRLAAMKGGE